MAALTVWLPTIRYIRIIRNMSVSRKTPVRRAPVGVSATEAAKNFGRLIDRVRETRATYVVERGGTPVATVSPGPPHWPGCLPHSRTCAFATSRARRWM